MNLRKILDSLKGKLTIGNLNDYANLRNKVCPNSQELFQQVIEKLNTLPPDSQFEYILSKSPSDSAYLNIEIKNLFINLFKV